VKEPGFRTLAQGETRRVAGRSDGRRTDVCTTWRGYVSEA